MKTVRVTENKTPIISCYAGALHCWRRRRKCLFHWPRFGHTSNWSKPTSRSKKYSKKGSDSTTRNAYWHFGTSSVGSDTARLPTKSVAPPPLQDCISLTLPLVLCRVLCIHTFFRQLASCTDCCPIVFTIKKGIYQTVQPYQPCLRSFDCCNWNACLLPSNNQKINEIFHQETDYPFDCQQKTLFSEVYSVTYTVTVNIYITGHTKNYTDEYRKDCIRSIEEVQWNNPINGAIGARTFVVQEFWTCNITCTKQLCDSVTPKWNSETDVDNSGNGYFYFYSYCPLYS